MRITVVALMTQSLSYEREARGAINPEKLASRDCSGSEMAEMMEHYGLGDEKAIRKQRSMCVATSMFDPELDESCQII